MKTQEQIVERARTERGQLFDFGFTELVSRLDFEHAREFLKDGTDLSDWEPLPLTEEAVTTAMRDYMEFAWEKANNCRGLSAIRSMQRFGVWLWLIDLDELAAKMGSHEFYGKPNLREICEHFGWPWQSWDDGRLRSAETDDGIIWEQFDRSR